MPVAAARTGYGTVGVGTMESQDGIEVQGTIAESETLCLEGCLRYSRVGQVEKAKAAM